MMVVADILYHDSNILRRSDPVRVKSMCGNLEFPCAHPCLFRIGELFAGRGCVHKIFSEGGKSGSVRAPPVREHSASEYISPVDFVIRAKKGQLLDHGE